MGGGGRGYVGCQGGCERKRRIEVTCIVKSLKKKQFGVGGGQGWLF